MDLTSKLAAIQVYDLRGWAMTPTRGKRPYRSGWQTERLGIEEMTEIVTKNPMANIGVPLGEPSRWLIDVDLDHPLAVAMADDNLSPTDSVFGRAGKPRSHRLYYVTAPVETQQHRLQTKEMVVELRSTKMQTVFPPSLHDSGERIEWDTDGEPAAITPNELSSAVTRLADAVRDRLGIVRPAPKVNGHAPPRDHQHHDRATIIDRAAAYLAKIPGAVAGQGGHDATFHAACVLTQRFALSVDESFPLLVEWNESCQPPWSEAELSHKLDSAAAAPGPRGELLGASPLGPSAAPRNGNGYASVDTSRPVTIFTAGERVKCGDRGNIGTVVDDDGGDTILVHFRSKDGVECDVDIDRADVKTADGEPVDTPPFKLNLLTTEQFLEADFRQHFLVKKVLVEGQPTVCGGAKKVLKTSKMVDLAVSLATGTPFLSHPDFSVPDIVPVMLLSGESGGYTLRETAKRIALARGRLLSSAPIFWGFDLPQIGNSEHLAVLADEIKQNGVKVVIIDPVYLCLLAAGMNSNVTSNVFAMGPLLKGISDLARDTGVTPILCHHTRKADRQSSPFGVPDLEDLSGSGFAEWARQWLLIGRREAYEAGSGEHRLWLNVGGSAGHSGTYAVDVTEGTVTDDHSERTWSVSVAKPAEAVAKKEEARQHSKQQKIEQHALRIRKVMSAASKPMARTNIRDQSGISTTPFDFAFALLLDSGEIVAADFKGANGKNYTGFTLIKASTGQPDNSTG